MHAAARHSLKAGANDRSMREMGLSEEDVHEVLFDEEERARSAARRIGAGWTLARRGKACTVFRRVVGAGPSGRASGGRGVRRGPCLGMGPTWEAAFDAALANEGR